MNDRLNFYLQLNHGSTNTQQVTDNTTTELNTTHNGTSILVYVTA